MSSVLFRVPVPHQWPSVLTSVKLLGYLQNNGTSSLHHFDIRSFSKWRLSPTPSLLQRLCVMHLAPPSRALQTARDGNLRRKKRWRRRDDMPAGFRLVYAAPSELLMRCSAGAVVAPLLLVPAVALQPVDLLLTADWRVAVCVGLYGLLVSAVLLLARRYPFRMYHSAERRQFRAVLTGPLLVNSRQLILEEGTVSRAQSATNIVPWGNALYTCPHGKLVLLDSGFQSAEIYNRLLGNHVVDDGEDGSGA